MNLHIEAYKLLVSLYNSPNRYYHNLNHIQFCLSKLDEYVYHNKDTTNIEMLNLTYAIWFHDAIYSIYPSIQQSNEEQSSILFYHFANNHKSTVGMTVLDIAAIENAIKCTGMHLIDNSDEPELTKILLDIDLAGFAKPYDIMAKDSEDIFKEYAPLGYSRKEMIVKRIEFYDNLLNKPCIFYTDYFHSTHEQLAVNNILENRSELSTELK